MIPLCMCWVQGPHCTGKPGKMAYKNSLSQKSNRFGIVVKTMDCVCSGCKFPDSQGKRSWIRLPSQFCVCNKDNSCKLTQGKFAVRHGKKTWNLKNAICISGCSPTRPACPPRGSPQHLTGREDRHPPSLLSLVPASPVPTIPSPGIPRPYSSYSTPTSAPFSVLPSNRHLLTLPLTGEWLGPCRRAEATFASGADAQNGHGQLQDVHTGIWR